VQPDSKLPKYDPEYKKKASGALSSHGCWRCALSPVLMLLFGRAVQNKVGGGDANHEMFG
jgi:hypothetical protein